MKCIFTDIFSFTTGDYGVRFIVKDGSLNVTLVESNTVTLFSWFVSVDSVACPFQCPIPFHISSAVEHTVYHVALRSVLLPILGTLIQCNLLSRHRICYVSFLHFLHDMWFVMPDLVLLLFRIHFSTFRFLLASRRNVFSSLISYLLIFLIHSTCITWL
jgi:hypothetical protein